MAIFRFIKYAFWVIIIQFIVAGCVLLFCELVVPHHYINSGAQFFQDLSWALFHSSPDDNSAFFLFVILSINAAIGLAILCFTLYHLAHLLIRWQFTFRLLLIHHMNCLLDRHEWIWEIKSLNSCLELQKCRYCKTIGPEQRENHQLYWEYEIMGSCNQIRTCRCRQFSNPGEKRQSHEMGHWINVSDNCHQRTCKRDNSHTEIEPHDWTISDASYMKTIPQGGRCIDPSWGLCEDTHIYVHAERYFCHKCGATR
jgi:hypothetical protein